MEWTPAHVAIIAGEIIGTLAIAFASFRLGNACKRIYVKKYETAVEGSLRNMLVARGIFGIGALLAMLLWIAGSVYW